MKKISLVFLIFIFAAALALTSCSEKESSSTTAATTSNIPSATTTSAVDYGTLAISDISVKEGSFAEINAVFSIPEKAANITYSFEGKDIKINDGKVYALIAGKTVTVTAVTEHHSATFKVTTLVDRGALTIQNVNAWIGYSPVDFFPSFSITSFAENLTYEYDSSAITIDAKANTITPLKSGIFEVKARSENFETTFTVNVSDIDKNSEKFSASSYADAAADRKSKWDESGVDGRTVVFIGDTIFAPESFTNFNTTVYVEKDALCLGISNTTTYDWEEWASSGWLSETVPESLVIHIGSYNIYDDNENAQEAASSIQRLLSVLHEKFPETSLYFCSITLRNSEKDIVSTEVNTTIKSWCQDRRYVTFVDTSANLDKDTLKDSEHIKIAHYVVFKNLLAKTSLVIQDIDKSMIKTIEDIEFTVSQEIGSGSGRSIVYYRGETLLRNYVLEGKLNIMATNGNPHIQFGILDNGNDRILLWDNEKNGNFKLVIPYTVNGIPEDDIYKLESGKTLTLEWKIICTDNDLYFYINGELKLVYTALASNGNPLTLGSTATDCKFYDMKAYTLEADKEEYEAVLDSVKATTDLYGNETEYTKIRV